MSDCIALPTGCLPWLPSDDSELTAVFHEYTIPLVGVVTQAGTRYIFWCVVGHAFPEQAWAYALAEDDAVERLANADAAGFDDALRAAVENRTLTFAIANDERGVSVSITLDPPASFDTVYERGMEALNEKIAQAREEYETLAAQFPLMRAPSIAPTPRIPEPA